MPPDNPFLQSILDHPEDDGPRLVYADWLEERGEADRAQFVRLECALARTSEQGSDFAHLDRRFWELRAKVELAWVSQIGVRRFLCLPELKGSRTLPRQYAITAKSNPQQGGWAPLYAVVSIRAEPINGSDVIIEDRCFGSTCQSFFQGCVHAITSCIAQEDAAGRHWRGCRVALLMFQHHPVDSSERAFHRAATTAMTPIFREAAIDFNLLTQQSLLLSPAASAQQYQS